MTENETAVTILLQLEVAVTILLQLEVDGWDNVVQHDDYLHIVTLSKGDRTVSAAGGNFLEVVQRVEGMTK
jgi:hypothetical protein